MTTKRQYEVIVGNIGRTYTGTTKADATRVYREYVAQSITGRGRAGHESVCLMQDGEPIQEHQGSTNDDDATTTEKGT